MGIGARVICDSRAPSGRRLSTLVLTFPRFILAELNTHRCASKCTASSRAIPYARIRQCVVDQPAMPVFWGKNQPGMQARVELDAEEQHAATGIWTRARDVALMYADELNALGVHKQLVNRLLEPWMECVTVMTAHDEGWESIFALRCHPDAQPEFRVLAEAAREALYTSTPRFVPTGEWHIPFVYAEDAQDVWQLFETGVLGASEDITTADAVNVTLRRLAVSRCARASYLGHDGRRDVREDLKLYQRLYESKPPHLSPFEHVAMALSADAVDEASGNFRGWHQFRKTVEAMMARRERAA